MNPIQNKLRIITYTLMPALLMAACSSGSSKDGLSEEEKVEQVKVMTIEKKQIENTVELTSTLTANEEVYLAPASPGRIEKIHVEVGARFRKGDLLVEMDKTQLHQASIQLKNLEVDMSRFDTLIKSNSVPRQQYDQFKTQYEIAQTNFQFLQQNSMLRAPFDGIVSGKYYQNGEMFSGAPNTMVGKAAVVSIVQLHPLKAIVNITERFFPDIKIGMTVDIITDVYQEKQFSGQVLRVFPVIDPVSRTFQVEIAVPNVNELLRPGMFCRANFQIGEVETFVLPAAAILKLQGTNDRYVFVAENGHAKRVNVTLGRRYDDMFEILSNGVKEGDKLIISGQNRLVDGAKINIVK